MTVADTAHRISLRDMTDRDLRRVRRIESAAYQDAWPLRIFEQELRNGFAQYRVAVSVPVGGVPVGPWGALRRRVRARDEAIVGFMGTWYMVDQLHLVTIAVDPPHQGKGIGARLLLDCFDLAIEAELPSIVLEVRQSNERAQRLYRDFGFREMGRLRAYYQDDGEDAIVMACEGLETSEGQQLHSDRWSAFRRRFGEVFAEPVAAEN
jgi:[ribosomal protein S18]-alanine N-acetyltransferase